VGFHPGMYSRNSRIVFTTFDGWRRNVKIKQYVVKSNKTVANQLCIPTPTPDVYVQQNNDLSWPQLCLTKKALLKKWKK